MIFRTVMAISIFVAYVVAAPMTYYISINPFWTHWFSPATYLWWGGVWVVLALMTRHVFAGKAA